ncbi:MAG: bifunctional demethylmenaquinone methyltransferase/2-methoxy-6-polyprenyl-1,4-benzoquinol methylase UbiE [Candidatus Caenarcaniphilales bacterium]|nr:bifunctional demethylmenaquinone methyltransferase/2-methoxy-6-polyprenyl-1,4-benzoquinol methylase UbiE [Candidatus Caenarcaniphilales bacterium]
MVTLEEDKSGYINNMFARIAKSYDFLNLMMTLNMHKLWKKQAIDAASVNIPYVKKAKILDLCTGTGDMAFEWSKKLQVSKVMAIDSCIPMLERAERRQIKSKKSNSDKITFMEADALALPFPDNHFDAVTVGFGLRNVNDLDLALAEIYRVLKPEGYIASLDLGHPESGMVESFHKGVFLKLMPLLGQIFAGDKAAYKYLIDSLETWPKQKDLSQMFWDKGFTRSYYKNIFLGTIAIVVAQK